MWTNLLIVAAILLGGTIVALVLLIRRNRRRGFRDWIRDPASFYEEAARRQAEVDVHVPADVGESEIRAQIDKLLDSKESRRAGAWLKQAGHRAAPLVAEALRDSRFLTSRRPDDHWFAKSGLDHLIQTAEGIASPLTVDPLADLLRNEDKELRKEAALALGSIGHDACVGPVLRALEDADENVRSYAIIGIQRAIKADRASAAFLTGIFRGVAPLMEQKSTDFDGTAASILLRADREQSEAFLLSGRVLRQDNPALTSVLRALGRDGVLIPEDTLSRLEAELSPGSHAYPHDRAYGQVLLAMAAARHPDAQAKVRAALDAPSTDVQERAAEALGKLRGIENAHAFVCQLREQVGWKGLTDMQRHYLAVSMLEAEVDNGGFSQYFFNSFSDWCYDALAGLNAIGARRTVPLLEKAMSLFGPDGPHPDRFQRQQQLARMADSCEKEFDALEDEFYKDEDRRERSLMLYVAEHPQAFGA